MLLIGNPSGKSFSSGIFSGISHSASCHTQRYVPALLLGDAGAPAAGSVCPQAPAVGISPPEAVTWLWFGRRGAGVGRAAHRCTTDACASGEEKDFPPDSLSHESLY